MSQYRRHRIRENKLDNLPIAANLKLAAGIILFMGLLCFIVYHLPLYTQIFRTIQCFNNPVIDVFEYGYGKEESSGSSFKFWKTCMPKLHRKIDNKVSLAQITDVISIGDLAVI